VDTKVACAASGLLRLAERDTSVVVPEGNENLEPNDLRLELPVALGSR
jgi:hypothetical protein